VNLAGSLLLKPAHRTTAAEWRGVMAANLDSSFHLLQAVVRSRPVGGPMTSLVFASSVAATLGLMNHEAIAAAKAGVEGLTRSAAATYGAQGLRVNAVAPSLTETPLTASLIAAPANRQAVTDRHVLGRIGTPDDVAAAIVFLLSTDSSWMTGQVIGIDGGLGSVRGR
jgi:3-oxoacyl-[acyl-carrier protein] reductase